MCCASLLGCHSAYKLSPVLNCLRPGPHQFIAYQNQRCAASKELHSRTQQHLLAVESAILPCEPLADDLCVLVNKYRWPSLSLQSAHAVCPDEQPCLGYARLRKGTGEIFRERASGLKVKHLA